MSKIMRNYVDLYRRTLTLHSSILGVKLLVIQLKLFLLLSCKARFILFYIAQCLASTNWKWYF